MKAYRYSVKLKLGLIVFAVLIAFASLAYTNQLVNRLREREHFIIGLWASAQEHMASGSRFENPYLAAFERLEDVIASGVGPDGVPLPADTLAEFERALAWARSMPPPGEFNLASEIVLQGQFGIPAIITDSTGTEPLFWHNVGLPENIDSLSEAEKVDVRRRLIEKTHSMSEDYEPIAIELGPGEHKLKQYIFYDESRLVRELRIFPYIQLLFVALLILVGYLGFSYVRRSEQSLLWVGMAKEAAHQLGTPISSLMGWTELLKMGDLAQEQQVTAVEEIENDIQRLRRVASRFSDIGSLPKLEMRALAPVVETTAEYMRRRMPQQARHVDLNVTVPDDLKAPLNAELFEWVIENLLKNALDAIESESGQIDVTAFEESGSIHIDVKDTGKGIDRRNFKNVFRPGYSTKKRGWGLGLSLAKRIVEDYHGGTLALAQSRVGYGTTFRITLPETTSRSPRARRGGGVPG